MNNFFVAIAAAATLFAAGCGGHREAAQRYPAEITGVGPSANFPLRVGEYRRGRMFTYRPGLVDISIAYDCNLAGLQNAVTLYFYPHDFAFEQQYALEKNQILLAHPGAKLIEERRLTLQKNGVSYDAQVASFVFEGLLAGQQQALISELVLLPVRSRYFKVRSSAPLAQADAAEAGMLKVLDAANWAF